MKVIASTLLFSALNKLVNSHKLYKEFKMKKKNIFYVLAITLAGSLLVAGCSGSSSSAAATPPSTPVNIALPANGGAATSVVNGPSALYLNDGITTTTNSWTGVATNDFITVSFNKVYSVSDFTLYLNFTNTTDTQIQVSTDGTTFTNLSLLSSCPTLTMGSGKITCTLNTSLNLMAMRVKLLAGTNAANTIQLYELQVTGQ